MSASETPPICDYEGSDYRVRFWEQGARDYEDRVERYALRRLLPPAGDTLLDVGAGFGRLANEYSRYRRIILLDYSRSLLREAQARLGHDPRYYFVAADWYQMPFVSGVFDAIVQVRTMHHAADAPRLLTQLDRVARPNADYVLEFANKQNLKAIVRYWLRRQAWSPHTPEPVEFATLNYDFHPDWMRDQLRAAGFAPQRRLAASFFRIPFLKRIVPPGILANVDRLLQPAGRFWRYTPSLIVHSKAPAGGHVAPRTALFACPSCGAPLPESSGAVLLCATPLCGKAWSQAGGLYDFKTPVS